MKRGITDRQLKYVVALMSKHFKGLRKIVLKAEYGVESTKDLTFSQADEIISKLNPDTFDVNWKARKESIAMKEIGQQEMFS